MRYVVLDLVLALLALAVLALLALGLWRRVTALGGAVRRAGDAVGAAMGDLEREQSGAAPSAGRAAPRGVRSAGRPRR